MIIMLNRSGKVTVIRFMSNSNNSIVLKLYKDGMVVCVNEEQPFEKIKGAVIEKFKKSEGFFHGATPHIGFKGIALEKEQCDEIINEISEIFGSEVTLWEEPDAMTQTTEEKVKEALNVDKVIEKALKLDVDNERTKFYKKTLRSGQLLESEGHIVIVGDVNPGAEVIAVGNIFVMGCVKGTVHAGAKGDREAIVTALNLSPTQLRIADIITRPPDGDSYSAILPEIAYIKDDKIFIEDFLQKRK